MTLTANTKKFGRQPSLRRPPIERGRWAAKGTKPLPDQVSIQHIITVMIIHLCRKVLFIETRVKITLYSLALFFGSLIFDFLPMPRTYLSQSDNILNLYFVKIGWAWLLSVVGSFVYLTSATYGCGKTPIIQQHMGRLLVGTLIWGFMTQWLFFVIESATGTCLGKASISDKWSCITSGYQWHAFDISGHAFLLVYMNLIIVEEAHAIVGWETMRELIFHEDHHRSKGPSSSSSATNTASSSCSDVTAPSTEANQELDTAPLRTMSDDDFFVFKGYYEDYTPFIRVLFIFMTVISLTCDVLLACTVIYFHTMPQKIVGGGLGIAAWYITYRVLFKAKWPGLPGEGGVVHYNTKDKVKDINVTKKKTIILTKDKQPVPMFMGMPMYGALRKDDKTSKRDLLDDCDETSGSGGSRPSTFNTCRKHRNSTTSLLR